MNTDIILFNIKTEARISIYESRSSVFNQVKTGLGFIWSVFSVTTPHPPVGDKRGN